ncbi:hypothetical protein [Aeromonas veronii]|uniref:pPIWI-associating nuclease domain-containing protein n=1 Tax=Aeromonas veronii TaxID=654 RepID=UPI003B9F76AA
MFGGAKNLTEKLNPLRLNNYSYAMRELTRHVLYRLAPDDYVIACPWYKNETNKDKGVTRKQRAYYAVQGGLDNSYVENTLGLEVDDIHSRLVGAINSLSKFTHIEPKVFDLPEADIDALVNETKRNETKRNETKRNETKRVSQSIVFWQLLEIAEKCS